MDLDKTTAYLVTFPFVWFATNLFLFGDSSYTMLLAIYICVIELICQICKENAWMNKNNRHLTVAKEDKGIQVGALHFNKYSQTTRSSKEMSTQTSLNQLDEYSQTQNTSVVDKTVQTFVATDNSHTQTSGVYKTTEPTAKSPTIDFAYLLKRRLFMNTGYNTI
ncbi:hypothetical protein CEXT_478351 [Caerostris extrusa]|uniref:Uncharacterized protein n=1 Tax=Caerostris extrusa TaxID=172846 RepID=A0AAV4WA58_CAEEX|nr:hypothetical protein CEXT_478351 [Caerostris extrusa]